MTKIQGYFNPFSTQAAVARKNFSHITSTSRKVVVVVLTILAALVTLPLLTLGGIATFHYLVEISTQSSPAPSFSAVVPTPSKKKSNHQPAIPCVDQDRPGLFVQVLNCGAYTRAEKEIVLSPGSMPQKVEVTHVTDLSVQIGDLKKNLTPVETIYTVQDLSTEEAICTENGLAKIALNFANEVHAGGGPGFHLDPQRKQFLYDGPSAVAQEESLCMHTNLMGSLTQLPHTLRKDKGSYMVRSYYKDPIPSRTTAYISQNQLFAVRGNTFHHCHYLDQPLAVSFITNAAPLLSKQDFSLADQGQKDNIHERIRTHLYAAAVEAVRLKKAHQGQTPLQVECILGAFGCGAFAPNNAQEYAEYVANVYKIELAKFGGIFDRVTFAIPQFGHIISTEPALRNSLAFRKVWEVGNESLLLSLQ